MHCLKYIIILDLFKVTFYRGKSPLNHHLNPFEEYVFFQPPSSNMRSWQFNATFTREVAEKCKPIFSPRFLEVSGGMGNDTG